MGKKTINEIVEEKLPTFANMIKDMTTKKELEGSFILYLREKEGLIMQKERDEELLKLKNKKAELSKPYTQTISALKKMMNCVYQFGHKFENELRQEFEKNLAQYAKQLSHVKRQKDEDLELYAVNEAIKDINEDYNPTIKTLELKCEYVAYHIKERFEFDEPAMD